jgi:CopG family nickel-responsive transcriptional regulator
MTIISVSLNDEYEGMLDMIQSSYGLKGRSEAVRASIKSAMGEIKDLDSMSGMVEGVLIIVRGNHADPWMIRIQAKYQECIKTQMHSHLRDQKCLEVMVVSADARMLKDMISDIKAEGKADYIRFVKG